MSKSKGRNLRISPFRRLVADLMHFSKKVPGVTIDRRMNLARLAAARQACLPRPGWCTLFTKAYAVVAKRYPELRRSYLPFPWPHLYEHPRNIATMNLNRTYGDEKVVIYALIRSPENRSLAEIEAIVREHKEKPLQEIGSFCRSMRLAHLPFPLRRLIWWLALNVSGRRRCHNFGTFGITTVAAQGAGVLSVIPLLASSLHYGLFDAQGCLEMRLSIDHRILDGVTAAKALTEMEAVLLGEILDEVRGMKVKMAA